VSVQTQSTTSTTRTDPVRVLDEMKRLAVEQLGNLPGGLCRSIEQGVQGAIANASLHEQTALVMLRQHSASHVMRFRQEIARGFDDFNGTGVRRDAGPLGLIEEHLLDLHLAGQRLAEILEQRYQRPLDVMKLRLGALAGALGLTTARNPVSPERLANAFVETYADAELPEALAAALFRQYQLELGKVLDDLYVRINALLATAGYGTDVAARKPLPTPSTRPWMRTDESTPLDARGTAPAGGSAPHGGWNGVPAPASFGAAGASEPAAAPSYATPATPGQAGAVAQPTNTGISSLGGDFAAQGPSVAPRLSAELAGLRAQLHAWRSRAEVGESNASPVRASNARRELRPAEVSTIASVLQSEPPDAYARALASSGKLGDAIRDHLLEGARRLGLSPEQTRLGEFEEDAIDMVALLFESLFRTHALQDRARRLYARLVMPYVKVALAGDSMFVQSQHPARRLLDAITEACEDNTASNPQDRELLEAAAAGPQRGVAEFNEDLAVFELAHAELEELLVQQRRRSEMQESRAAKATYGRERLTQARLQADQMLQRRLADQPLTPAVAEYLCTPWRHHLVQTLLRDGGESLRMAEAVQLGDALVDCDVLASEARGRELGERLIALEPAIVDCLGSSGLDAGSARHGMAMVVRDLARPDTVRREHSVPPLAAEDPSNDDPRLSLVGGTAQIAHDPGVAAMIRRLQPGEWLRLKDETGETNAVKIAWVSPLTSRLLLVNRRGIRVLVASPEELAAMVGAGKLVLGGERTPFSEAMQQLQQRLDSAVGHR